MADEDAVYTCKTCGCHQFYVIIETVVLERCTQFLECDCGDFRGGRAAEVTTKDSVRFEAVYELDDQHHFNTRLWEEELDREKDVDDPEETIYCQECYDSAAPDDWMVDTEPGAEDEDETVTYFVRCGKCQREIEFGWSHPDRGGRIWPVESSDFNPWKSWPEPRFRESWREKGWLRCPPE